MDNILSFIGLMKRAGALAIGAENAFDCCREKKARLLCTACDTSENTSHGMENARQAGNVALVRLPYSKARLGEALGQQECAAFAITDTGFALSLAEKTGFSDVALALSPRLEREKRRKAKKMAKHSTHKGERV